MKKLGLFFLLLIVLALLAGGGWYGFKKYQSKNTSAVSYEKLPITRGTIQVTIVSQASVEPENKLEIKLPIAGRVEDVLVDEGDKVTKGQILAWMSSSERAGLLDAARARGAAELKRWEDFYKPTPVIAPINGTIIARNAEPGQTFTTADAILVMSDRLSVKALVDETDLAQISLKQKAIFTLDAYPNQEIPAYVEQIAFDSKTVNNVTTYTIDVLPTETPSFMRSGMTANVTFFVAEKENVLLIPSEAIKIREGHHFVLVNGGTETDLQPVEQEITVGLSDGKNQEVLSGLEDGDYVLVAKLKKVDSTANQNPFVPIPPRPKKK